MQNRYGFGKSVAMGFDEAMVKVTAELQKEGFGVLTEIDVAGTLKKKLDHNMPPYRILGACNPALAKRALAAEPGIGLLLPCNVVVRQTDDGTVVEAIDPMIMVSVSGVPALQTVADEAAERLKAALAVLTA